MIIGSDAQVNYHCFIVEHFSYGILCIKFFLINKYKTKIIIAEQIVSIFGIRMTKCIKISTNKSKFGPDVTGGANGFLVNSASSFI